MPTRAKLDYSLYLVTGRELLPQGKVSYFTRRITQQSADVR